MSEPLHTEVDAPATSASAPVSTSTGPRRSATKRTVASGSCASTSYGPIASSAVMAS
jgi:hypothetical protein